MNRYKKIVSFVCALCMMVGLLPVTVNATDNGEIEKAFHGIPQYFQTDYDILNFGKLIEKICVKLTSKNGIL